eukprot:gi/632987564/ref/XP_007882626.1/ PREDICTED: uncharacterized protein LOC103171647 [Callorhinchus milii]
MRDSGDGLGCDMVMDIDFGSSVDVSLSCGVTHTLQEYPCTSSGAVKDRARVLPRIEISHSIMSFWWIFLSLSLLTPGSSGSDTSVSYVVSNGSSAVLLPCSAEAGKRFKVAVWECITTPWREGYSLCEITENQPVCNSPHHTELSVADSNAFQSGNVSLLLTPTMSQAGEYHCNVYKGEKGNKRVYKSIIHLIVFHVSVSADNSLTPGGRLALTCNISHPGYFNTTPTIHTNGSITAGRIEVLWTHNGNVIISDTRHCVDLRSLNISKVQQTDSGSYRYNIKIKDFTPSYQKIYVTVLSSSLTTQGIVNIVHVSLAIALSLAIIVLLVFEYRSIRKDNSQERVIEDTT